MIVCVFFFTALLLLQAAVSSCSLLGVPCSRDDQCSIQYARCQNGRCSCLPYYAPYNGSQCLQSTLLGFECKVSEQCYQKVANSTCLGGVCRCDPGYLQFRRHTCLSPAKLGDVCYSDTHCRLWETGSHCDFLIPKLFGRCVCTPPLRQSKQGAACLPPVWPTRHRPTTTTTTTTSTTSHYTDKPTNPYYKRPSSPFLQLTTPSIVNTIPPSSKGKPAPLKVGGVPGRPLRTPAPTGPPITPTASLTTTSTPATHTTTTSTRAPPPATKEPPGIKQTQLATNLGPVVRLDEAVVSLGQRCVSDRQCRSADPASRCVRGLCDCAVRNATGCGARNTGCHPATFQCRATGQCISWYFVCDGRADCADGSDELCAVSNTASQCPGGSFRCWRSGGRCVSAAARCDGHRDCPHGEDEAACRDLSGSGCPGGTMRCAEGSCLPAYEFCNAHVTCPDGSDEPEVACQARGSARAATATALGYCPFRCANGRCRSSAVVCSGRDGCGDGSDEEHCSVCRCPSL